MCTPAPHDNPQTQAEHSLRTAEPCRTQAGTIDLPRAASPGCLAAHSQPTASTAALVHGQASP